LLKINPKLKIKKKPEKLFRRRSRIVS